MNKINSTIKYHHFNVDFVISSNSARLFLNTSRFCSIKYGRSKFDSLTMNTSAKYVYIDFSMNISFSSQSYIFTCALLSVYSCPGCFLSPPYKKLMSMKISSIQEQISYRMGSMLFQSLWAMYSFVIKSNKQTFSNLHKLAILLSSLQIVGEHDIIFCITLLKAQNMEQSNIDVKKKSISFKSIPSSFIFFFNLI